jgi:23S rRNA pseudouridine955/2504/2580 synthase
MTKKEKELRFTPEDLEARILYEDDDLFCLNKPVGISTLAERNQPGTGLLDIVRINRPEAKVCHRLDKHTSGVLLYAKHLDAFRALTQQFEHREVAKHYRALIEGSHKIEQLLIEAPIAKAQNGQSRVDFSEGKEAATLVNTFMAYRHYTLLDCQPFTGRPHQIRVHLAYISFPIIGDEVYGGGHLMLSTIKRRYKPPGNEEEVERPLERGFVLHAHSLTFAHPSTNEPMTVEAPPSKNLEVCLKVLEKYDRL